MGSILTNMGLRNLFMPKLPLYGFVKLFFLTFACLIFVQTAAAQNAVPPKTAAPDKETPKAVEKAKIEEKKTEAANAIAARPIVKGKLPVIIIPGLIGSELINRQTNETVWFNLQRSKKDDLRLPISPNLLKNRDNLQPGDILRSVKILRFLPEPEIYQKLTGTFEANGGYTEGKWDAPPADGYQDTYYVFPYDWRRDNVENARLLIRRIQALKQKLGKPNLKFNIVAHSMGGIIARYAARYGDTDLPASGIPRLTWAGAAHINKIFLIGTPNEGSVSALDSLLNGLELLNAKGLTSLPFVQDLSKFDVFTSPAAFQLLPHTGTLRAYDEYLKPLKIDLYDPATWEKYGWAAYQDKDFAKKFSPAEQASARAYFRVVLSRANRLQLALDSNIGAKTPVQIYLFGSDCKPTPDAMILYRNQKKGEWRALFRPDSFERNDGTKVSSKEVEELFNAPGDGVVSKRSFLSADFTKPAANGVEPETAFRAKDVSFVCEVHNKLTGNLEIQNSLLEVLSRQETTATTQK